MWLVARDDPDMNNHKGVTIGLYSGEYANTFFWNRVVHPEVCDAESLQRHLEAVYPGVGRVIEVSVGDAVNNNPCVSRHQVTNLGLTQEQLKLVACFRVFSMPSVEGLIGGIPQVVSGPELIEQVKLATESHCGVSFSLGSSCSPGAASAILGACAAPQRGWGWGYKNNSTSVLDGAWVVRVGDGEATTIEYNPKKALALTAKRVKQREKKEAGIRRVRKTPDEIRLSFLNGLVYSTAVFLVCCPALGCLRQHADVRKPWHKDCTAAIDTLLTFERTLINVFGKRTVSGYLRERYRILQEDVFRFYKKGSAENKDYRRLRLLTKRMLSAKIVEG